MTLTAAFGVQQDARFPIAVSLVGSEEALFKRALRAAKSNCSVPFDHFGLMVIRLPNSIGKGNKIVEVFSLAITFKVLK
ncbi:hypothetical protein M2308_000420 [Rhizobium leguminosarum]|nr:hypothetical protein [Rhizobium leguminosarum]